MSNFFGSPPEKTTLELKQTLRGQNETANATYCASLLARTPDWEFPVPTSAEVIALDEIRRQHILDQTVGEIALSQAVGE